MTQPQLIQIPLPEGMVRVQPVEASNTHALEMLLTLEAEARQASTLKEFIFFITNETRKILSFRQAFCVQLKGDNTCETVAVSSIANVERNAPLIASLEAALKHLRSSQALNKIYSIKVDDLGSDQSIDLAQYPFPNLLWMPFAKRDGTVFAGLLMARETPWTERDLSVSTRLSSTYAHAWCALVSASRMFLATTNRKPWMLGAVIISLLVLFIPMPMSTLAPVEVVAREPIVVAAPIEGVIESIKIEPNTRVKAGDALLSFQNTTLKNKYDIAERSVQVARAKELKATQSAFTDSAGRHEVAIAMAELKLSEAERDYAKDMLAKTVLVAPKDGLAIFSSRKDWEGKPVLQGERIIEIADPSRIEFGIDLSVKDAIVLHDGAEVKVFLDFDPLHAVKATLTRASYHAQPSAANGLSYTLFAKLNDGGDALPRIGYRGTAQVYGNSTFLGFYLFRRPIAALRQMIGM
jgi:multidrug resistance efflux pump